MQRSETISYSPIRRASSTLVRTLQNQHQGLALHQNTFKYGDFILEFILETISYSPIRRASSTLVRTLQNQHQGLALHQNTFKYGDLILEL